MNSFGDKVSFIWSVADLLRGPYKPPQYGRVILPLTVLRRLDCVLEPTKEKVLAKAAELKGGKVANADPILNRVAKASFHNTSKLDFRKLKGEPDKMAANLTAYIKGFSSQVRDIFEKFNFEPEIARLDENNRLFLVVSKFAEIDLHPDRVTNIEMGYIFEELIRRFNEAANETAGDHFTPREVIRLIVNLLFAPDRDLLVKKGVVRTLFDPACGTGGMLAVADEYLHELNPDARLEVFGQDHNPESYAVCGSDMLIKGHNIDHIVFGSSFTKDGFSRDKFDYLLANPPFGVEWKPEQDAIEKEHETLGYDGRFGAGTPRINDGSFLFLQHMISKMKSVKDGGSRIGIVFNGSPLFTGDAGSGESEIRRWIIENDWLDVIVALPDQLFYNTGIYTYVWIVTNRKPRERRGKVQLINGVHFVRKMRKSLNNKRNEIAPEHIDELTKIYGNFRDGETWSPEAQGDGEPLVVSKIFDNADFGFRQITIERPLRLNFQASPERIERLREITTFQNLAKSKKKEKKQAAAEESAGRKQQEAILAALGTMNGAKLYKERDAFLNDLETAFAGADIRLAAPIRKAILSALSERDETSEICRDGDGNPESDSELRDYENVPLKESIYEYFEREVKPHVPDAWINECIVDKKDGGIGVVGYKIPFVRAFFEWPKPVTLSDIEQTLMAQETHVRQLLDIAIRGTSLDVPAYSAAARNEYKRFDSYKESGIPNVGSIPDHWRTTKLGFIASVKARLGWKGLKAEEYVNDGFAFLSTPNIKGRDIDFDNVNYINEMRYLESPEIMLELGDVLIAKDGSTLGTTNVVRTLPRPSTVNSSIAVIRPQNGVYGVYLYYLLASRYTQLTIQLMKDGQGVPHLFQSDLRKFDVWLPPPEEQEAIAAYLDQETRILDELLLDTWNADQSKGSIAKLLRLLRLYRAELIFAAVTGKIDVREFRAEGTA